MSNLPKKVLFVDDDPTIAEGLEGPLLKRGIELVRAVDLETALYLFNQKRFEVAIVELEFGPLNGLALVQKFRANDNHERASTGMIVSCGKSVKKTDEGLLNELGDLEFVEKPITEIKLLPFLTRAIERMNNSIKFDDTKALVYDVFAKTGDADQAIATLNENITGLGENKLSLMSEILESAGRFEDGIKLFDKVLDGKPSDVRALNAKGRLLLKAGRAQEAREFMERAQSLAPYNIERTETMSQMYLELEDPESSVNSMRDLINLNPENSEMRFDLFQDLDDAGYQEHAVGLCKETTSPKEVVKHYNNKGVAMSRTGDTERALADYYKALVFYPKFKDNYRILFNIALAEVNKKTPEGYEKAHEAIQKCLNLAPDFEKAQKLLPLIETRLEKLKKSS